jgi:hypothetical protein
MNGSYPAARSFHGTNGGRPRFTPLSQTIFEPCEDV